VLGATAPTLAIAGSGVSTTGNVLVLLARGRATAAAATATVDRVASSLGARRAGSQVPQIGLITLRPPAGVSAAAFAGALRKLPGVANVELEHRLVPRAIPNDPALHDSDPYTGVIEWMLAREGFYGAWNISRGAGARVGVIDSGIDANHPDLRNKIAAAVDHQDPLDASGTARTDEMGHGTHVSSLACAETGNGIGIAGAGYDCKLVVEKSDFSDSSIASSIVDAANRQVQALNMSFGPDSATPPPAPASEVRALHYAADRRVVLVAAAGDMPATEQGDPANVLQPAGSGPQLNKGLGLDVTAADYSGQRASFAGYGSEISLAAFGAFDPSRGGPPLCLGAPAGLLAAFPPPPTELDLEAAVCRRTYSGARYAYLQGTSMAAPQVAGAAALIRLLNPYATLTDVLRTLKQTAQRPRGTRFRQDLGWGILDAGAALRAAQRIDRVPPVSHPRVPRVAHHRVFRLRWSGHDRRIPGLIASGIRRFLIYVGTGHHRRRLLAKTTRHSLRFRGRPGHRYVFFVVAVDRAGNHERKASSAVTRVTAGAQ
jgi:serine protease